MPPIDQLNAEYLAVGFVGGLLALAAATPRPTRPLYPLLATIAVALLTPRLELTVALAAAALVAAVACGWGARTLSRTASPSVLGLWVLVGLGGAWTGVPDTEAVVTAIGVILPAAVVAVVRRPPMNGTVGWTVLALAVAVAIAASSDEQLAIVFGALGCLAAVPVVALAARVDVRAAAVVDVLRAPRPASVVAVVPLAATVVCGRVATGAARAPAAALVVAGSWLVAGAALLGAARAIARPGDGDDAGAPAAGS